MFGVGKKRKQSTDVQARQLPPMEVNEKSATDDGRPDFVGDLLVQIQRHARREGVSVGEWFDFTIVGKPTADDVSEAVMFALWERCSDYGLRCNVKDGDKLSLTRMA